MKDVRYFKGLNSLRFFAAFLVIIFHARESIAVRLGYLNVVSWNVFFRGKEAVDFFFTLSGFLITYLLLQEINRTKELSIKGFYKRRILRIWPLYFLITGIGFLVIGYFIPRFTGVQIFNFPNTFVGFLFYLFFLPNVVCYLYKVGFLFPLWSIGVEEQYYLIWAPLCKLLKNKIWLAAAILFVLGITFRICALYTTPPVSEILTTLKFHRMAIGAFFAYLLFNTSIASFLKSRFIQLFIIIISFYQLFWGISIGNPVVMEIVISGLYSLLFIVVSVVPAPLLNLENRVLSYLGSISFGLYLWHMIIEWPMRTFVMKKISPNMNGNLLLFIYCTTLLCLAAMVAGLSYKFYERRFHRAKTISGTTPVLAG